MSGYCANCNNTGYVDCHCGGDLCICENNGEYPCPDCGGDDLDEDGDFFLEEGFDAGEWTDSDPPKPKTPVTSGDQR